MPVASVERDSKVCTANSTVNSSIVSLESYESSIDETATGKYKKKFTHPEVNTETKRFNMAKKLAKYNESQEKFIRVVLKNKKHRKT